ncbi:hypothetical protein H8S90_17525 [Olivibacter sp. SDN3]|uniref:hypothetical protein n=1 Tax=Olivibacter sp. SDN3 TaxID=2764720 RepID=UPI0016518E70|nr:hypothetical protein [Olivibacter sp. SDN3]QNL48573.1 hypothetical protein H8S90_17525 [Olivibacter sp. SDN3]
MKHSLLYLAIALTSLSACNNIANENQQLQDEVIAVHDSIMPKMGTIVRDNLKVSILLTKMDSLKKINPALDTTLEKENLANLQEKLKEANESMTDWMHEFDADQEDKTPEEVRNYLQGELGKIQEVKVKFAKASAESQQVLEKYK